MMFLILALMFVLFPIAQSFNNQLIPKFHVKSPSTSLKMSINSFSLLNSGLADSLGLIPLCLKASSKSTTINDPTGGMTPDEISNYLDNVGGG